MEQQEQSKKALWLDASWIAAISAIFVGLSALGVSVYQSYLMHEQQRMSVWPFLSPMHSDVENGYLFSVQNDGVGPALVHYVDVRLDNKPVTSWAALFSELKIPTESIGPYSTLSNRVFATGMHVQAIRLMDVASGINYRNHLHRIQLDICYCSIYQDCYQYSTHATVTTQKVERCPSFEQQVFEN